jgi:cation transport regulator ChaB
MIAGDLSRAKAHLSEMSVGVVGNFMRILELIRLAHGGVKAIRTGVYEPTEFKIPDQLSSEVRQILAEHMQELRLGSMLASVDAAAFVFAHAILDDLAMECCKVSTIADPLAWESAIINRQVNLSELKAQSFEEIYDRLVQEYLANLERRSLEARIDMLHQKCPPSSRDVVFPSIFENTAQDYKYDRDRIRRIDRIRQDILHRVALNALAKSIEANIADIAYVERSCYYLLWLVSEKYRLGIMATLGSAAQGEESRPQHSWSNLA